MTDDRSATGVLDAVLVDYLFGLGVDDVMAMSREQRMATVLRAVDEGRLSADQVALLRDLGVLPPVH